MKTASAKAKGNRLEKYVIQRMKDILGSYGVEVKRVIMSGASDWWKGDVWSSLPVHIECKNQEKVSLWEWWEQTDGQAPVGKLPVLVIGKNFKREPLAVIKLEDLLFFMELAVQSGWVSSLRKGRKIARSKANER